MADIIKHRPSILKWKLILIFALLIIGVAAAVVAWVSISFDQYVRDAEIGRFRSSVIAALRIESKNYYTSRDEGNLKATIAEVKRVNPDLDMVFISDEEGQIVGEDSKAAGVLLGKLEMNTIDNWTSPIEMHENVDINGEEHIIITYKGELDPYAIHFGFSTKVIISRVKDLSRRISFVVWLTAGLTILLGAGFLHAAVRPIEKLAKDSERLSFGDLSIKLRRSSRTEVGRIYSSLSRLRESILYSMKRLNMQ